MLQADFMALCFIEPELLPVEVLHCRYRYFGPPIQYQVCIYCMKLSSGHICGCIVVTVVRYWASTSRSELSKPAEYKPAWLHGMDNISSLSSSMRWLKISVHFCQGFLSRPLYCCNVWCVQFHITLCIAYIFGRLLKYILWHWCRGKFHSAVHCELSDLCFTNLYWSLRKCLVSFTSCFITKITWYSYKLLF